MAGMITAVLIVSVHTWYSILLAIALWGLGLPRLQQLGKSDPIFFDVFRRHVRLRGRGGAYNAQAHYTAISPTIRKHLR